MKNGPGCVRQGQQHGTQTNKGAQGRTLWREIMTTRTIPVSAWPTFEGVDIAEVADRLGGDLALFLRLFDRMLSECRTALGDLPGTRSAEQGSGAAAVLHRLKGQAANLCAHALAQELAALERQAKLHPMEPLEPLRLIALMSRVDRLDGQLRAWRQEHGAAAPRPRDEPVRPGLDAAALAIFRGELAQRRACALESYAALQPALRASLDEATFNALDAALREMRFKQAATLLNLLDDSGTS